MQVETVSKPVIRGIYISWGELATAGSVSPLRMFSPRTLAFDVTRMQRHCVDRRCGRDVADDTSWMSTMPHA